MGNIEHRGARPVAVKLALILLAFDFAVVFMMNLIYAEWGNVFSDVSFAVLLIFNGLPLWFLFHGKNWARWFVAIVTVIEVGLSFWLWSRHHQTFSNMATVWFWLDSLLSIIIVIALFHASSNRWFCGHQTPPIAG